VVLRLAVVASVALGELEREVEAEAVVHAELTRRRSLRG
jgi:hypothetical protein